MGLTGHFAFNDPPEPGATDDPLGWLRECRARKLSISRESTAQMVMGGSHGNWAIVPRRACTLGMKELLASKHIHLTFTRSWHSGVLRRALFGPISADCPGSLVQEHPSVEATLTELAAAPPLLDVAQDTGE
jgi:glucosamine-6-phosphate deaminase